MKKIIVTICFLLCAYFVFVNGVYADGAVEVYILDPVKGCANCTIDEDLDVYLDPESPDAYYSGITVGQDVGLWFNVPSGINATVKSLNNVDKPDVLTINFTGTLPDEDSSTPIEITVPANTVYVGDNPYIEDLENEVDNKLAFIISKPTLDYADNYEIVGEIGKEITPISLTITISDSGVAQTEFHDSFLNYEFAPINGLNFKVTNISSDKKSIDILVSGTPTSVSSSTLSLIIPAIGTVNKLCDLNVPIGKAIFNIVDNTPEPEPPVYIPPVTGVN